MGAVLKLCAYVLDEANRESVVRETRMLRLTTWRELETDQKAPRKLSTLPVRAWGGSSLELLDSIIFRQSKKSPFDVPGIQTKATTKDILEAVRTSRERIAER